MALSGISPQPGYAAQQFFFQSSPPYGTPPTPPAARDIGLLSDTVSLSPPSPIDPSFESKITSSQTVAGPFAQEFFQRPLSHEPLVDITNYGIDGKAYYAVTDGSNPPYDHPLAGARPTIYVRKSVAERLQAANDLLRPFGYELYVLDGWRDPITQHAIFRDFEAKYLQQHPGATVQEARAHALRYASDPHFSPSDPMSVPLHATGGAVDVTLSPIGQHHPLWLGSPFDSTTPRSHTAFFETHPPQNQAEALEAWQRRLLNAVMLKSGFTNYPNEWWHFDFADRMYASYSDLEGQPVPSGVNPYGFIQLLGSL